MLNKLREWFKKRMAKPYKEKMMTYTKMLVTALTVLAAIWISWSYVLATIALLYYGNVDPLATVSEEVCRTIIATVIGYCVKALCENISKYTVMQSTEDADIEHLSDGGVLG